MIQAAGMAIIGLASQLFNASLTGYTILETIESFGSDFDDLNYQLNTEKIFFEKWAKAWVEDQSNQQMESNPYDYLWAVDTLARISAIFGELSKYVSRYDGPVYSGRPRKREVLLRPVPVKSLTPPGPAKSTPRHLSRSPKIGALTTIFGRCG
jgi:hypothetical protein